MKTYRIGTRGSPLALAQTQEFIHAFEASHPALSFRFEIIPIKTMGDTITDRSLLDLGGKSLFTKEIEKALLNKEIDFAVHSMKDVTIDVPEGLTFPAILEREDPRDALITRNGKPFEELAPDARFGTSSLRRQAFVLHKHPSFEIVSFRGNIQTRLKKLENGEVDGTLLAVAGLKRLGFLQRAVQILPPHDFIPAVGQGALGIQCRQTDETALKLLFPLNHLETFQAVTAERAFLKALNGSCRTPIAGYAYLQDSILYFHGMVSDPQGQALRFVNHQGSCQKAQQIGQEASQLLQSPS